MGIGARILGDELIVIRRPEKPGRPAVEAVLAVGFFLVDGAVSVVVVEEVRIGVRVIADGLLATVLA